MLEEMNPGGYAGDFIYQDRASVMLVCINGCHEDMPYGNIVSYYLAEPVYFKGTSQLILGIDQICETVGAPMRTVEPRFLSAMRENQYRELSKIQKPINSRDAAECIAPYASKAKEIVIIQVLFRQNASMQGRIHCTYTGRTFMSFRSALELMRMLEEIGANLQGKERTKNTVEKEELQNV